MRPGVPRHGTKTREIVQSAPRMAEGRFSETRRIDFKQFYHPFRAEVVAVSVPFSALFSCRFSASISEVIGIGFEAHFDD